MASLPQLLDRERYRSCDWDLKADARGRAYWVKHFCKHLETLSAAIVEEYPKTSSARLEGFRNEYLALMRALDDEPRRYERIDILFIDQLRHELLKRHGFDDPFRGVKRRENEAAMELLSELLAELDGCPRSAAIEKLAIGLMAGNLFDLGALPAARQYAAHGADFRRARTAQPVRPWLIDDLESWRERWMARLTYRHVAFFVDNAGADICLGCLPLARWLLGQGSRVTLAANSAPALNDITAPEFSALLRQAAAMDGVVGEAVAAKRLSIVASGGWAPLIDLTELADECADAIGDADLVILHGMGRAVESNWRALFGCDSLRVAVLKDRAVARRLGGRLFDCVFRFERVC